MNTGYIQNIYKKVNTKNKHRRDEIMAGINGLGNAELQRLMAQYTQAGNTENTNQTSTANNDSSIFSSSANVDTVDITAAEDEIATLQGTSSTSATSGTESVATSEEGQKILEEIEELEKEKEENLEKMEKLEAHIEDLTAKAEENIMKAAAAQEDAVKEHEKETQAVVDEQLKEYVAANKEGGEGMTREELQGNIQGALAHIPEVANAVSALVEANDQINEIDACLGDLNDLILDTQSIEAKIEGKEAQFEAAEQAAQAAAAASSNNCCDPIGFQTTDENGNTVQYDFIKDDGSFDSTSDFLGSDNQWAEMQALDADGDQTVTAAELSAGNIKAVKTNADGSQEIVDLASEFGDDFSIDLTSYQAGGSHSAIDTTKDSDGDGVLDQELLGTFNVNANGQTIQGYNTLDDVDYLSENYGVSAATSEAAEATDSFESEYSEDLQPHVDFFNTYTQKVQELKEALMQGWEQFDISEETMEEYNETSINEANKKAASFFKSLELSEEEGEDEISETDEAELENESDLTSDDKLEKELEKDLELFAA